MKNFILYMLLAIPGKSVALFKNVPMRVKGCRASCFIEMLLMCFLLTCNVMQTVEAASVKFLTLVSLTFDDGLKESAAIQPLIDTGLKATFYVNSDRIRLSGSIDNLDYLTKGELDTLFNNGSEIGGHSIGHVNLATLTDPAQQQAICDDLLTLRGWYGDNVYSFAYPFTSLGPTTQGILAGGCSGTYGPLNKPIGKYESARGGGGLGCLDCPYAESLPPANPYYIKTIDGLTPTTTLDDMKSYITQAEANGGGWVTLLFHGVCDGTECGSISGVSRSTFRALLDWLKVRESQGTYVRTIHQVMSGDYPPPPPPPQTWPNQLINSSLEVVQAGNNKPYCWEQSGFGTNTAIWTRTTDAYTGGFAQQLQISSYNNGDRKLLPSFDAGQKAGGCAPSVKTDAIYQISAYYKSTAIATVPLFYLDANNTWQYWKNGPDLPVSSNYTRMLYYPGTLPAGAQAISFGIGLNRVGTLTTDDYSFAEVVDSPPAPNVTPVFVGGSTILEMAKNSPALNLTANLHVSDTDTGQTETWSPSVAPAHGKLTISGAIASSGSVDITPGGTITYKPTAGYSGSDSFTVQVSDGIAIATRTFSVTITSNTVPTFVGGTTTLTVSRNSSAVNLKPNVHVSDTDTGQTLTWSPSVAPSHGKLALSAGATASSGKTNITPGETINYKPTNGYSGPDSFALQVSDGIASAVRMFTVTVQ